MSRFLPACAIACAYLSEAHFWDDEGVSLLQRAALQVRVAGDPVQDDKQELWAKLVGGPSVQGDTAIVPAPAEAAPQADAQSSGQTIEEMEQGITHIAVQIHDGVVDVMSAPEVARMDVSIVGSPRGMALQWVGHHCEFSDVREGGAAARAGIRTRDRLLAINGVPVASFDDVFRILPRSGDFNLTYARPVKMVTGHLSNKTHVTMDESPALPEVPTADSAPVAPTPEPSEATEQPLAELAAAPTTVPAALPQPVGPPSAPADSTPEEHVTVPPAGQPGAPLGDPSLNTEPVASGAFDGLQDMMHAVDSVNDLGLIAIGIEGEPRGFAMRWRKNAPMILSVARGSPASRAGLAAGDRILQISGQRATSLQHATQLIPAQGSFTVAVARSAAEHLSLMSGGGFSPSVSKFDADRWQQMDGVFRISVRGPTRGLETSYAEGVGAVVRTVQPSTSADISGFQTGDVIERVNGAAIMSATQLSGLLEDKDAVVQIDFTRGVH